MKQTHAHKAPWFKNYLLLSTVGLVVVIAVGFFAIQFAKEQNVIPYLKSKAEFPPPPFWPHDTLPTPVTLVNHTSRIWTSHIASVTADWHQAGVVTLNETESKSDTCDLNFGEIQVCSYDAPNTGVIAWGQRGSTADLHILAAQINLNDAYLVDNRTYGREVWRNYTLCGFTGFMLGLWSQVAPPEGGTSCMESTNFVNVYGQQHPSNPVLTDLKRIYSSANASTNTKTAVSDELLAQIQYLNASQKWGTKVGTSPDGTVEYYHATLADNASLDTVVLLAPSYR